MVDCAHGHNIKVVAAVKDIKGSMKAEIIAGNIATRAAAEAMVSSGVDGIRGVLVRARFAPPALLQARVPQIIAIAQGADVARNAEIPIIADSGVRFSGDVAKAIAAGADTVMTGSMFAGTDEAPGKIITIKGRR